jgi:hypothetical protein
MADTPLELYEEAYRLHYHEKKIQEAVKIYETIIRDFPDSNECGYAFIQLQKVKANDISKMLKKGPASLYPMIIIAFVTSLIALAIGIIGTVYLFQQLRQEHRRSTIAMMALGKMYSGSSEFADKLIDELKKSSPVDPLSASFTSDMLAQKRVAALTAQLLAAQTAKPPASDSTFAQKPALAKPPAARTKAVAPARRTAKQNRNPIFYGADSISYF